MKFSISQLFFTYVTILCSFQVHLSNALFMSYVSFISSLKLGQLTGSFLDGLYPTVYNDALVQLVEKNVVTEEILSLQLGYDFCDPKKYNEDPIFNFIEVIAMGERPSLYEITVPKNETCKHLCTKTYVGGNLDDRRKLDLLKRGIVSNFRRHLIVNIDTIPVLWCPPSNNHTHCVTGFPFGCHKSWRMFESFCFEFPSDKYFIFNHIDLIITYGKDNHLVFDGRNALKLLSVKVIPSSINNTEQSKCSSEQHMELPYGDIPDEETFEINYTYSVTFVESDTLAWSRWNNIFKSLSFVDLHWLLLVCSILFVLLVVMVPIIILKALYKDAIFYRKMKCGDDVEERFRWKLVSDMFIPPAIGIWLSLLLGSVILLALMTLTAVAFAIAAIYLPNSRAEQMACAMVVFICQGALGGYTTSRMYKNLGGEQWKTHVLATTVICPGVAVSVFAVLDITLMFIDSSASVPLFTLCGVLGLWFLCIIPFTFVGSLFAFTEEITQLKNSGKELLSRAKAAFNPNYQQ